MGRELLFQNMPNITLMEALVVCAAVALLYVGPAVLAWSDERRQRKLQAQAARARQAWAEPMAPSVDPLQPAAVSGDVPAPVLFPDTSEPAVTAGEVNHFPGINVDTVPLSEPIGHQTFSSSGSAVAAPATAPPTVTTAVERDDRTPLELQPLDGPARHCFRLADLHQTRLPDWPPSVIRDDPERHRLWQEAERVAEEHRAVIATAAIWSPYPARASCLGAAETEGGRARVHFLLFPVPWPVTQSQAVAQAVFEIDRARGEIRGWVDALRESELTDHNRREIRESGGAA